MINKSNLNHKQVQLSSGVSMQVLSMQPERTTDKPVLLFLHGSFHGGWCWSEKYFSHFVERGFTVVAPSWRGTGGTFAGEGVKKVKIMEHVADLEALLVELPNVLGRSSPVKPIVISHSFAGLAVMKCLEAHPENVSCMSGIANMCVVPPSGNGKMTLRYIKRSLADSWKITAGFAMKQCLTNASLCRVLFFGGDKQVLEDGTVVDHGVSDQDVARYQACFARDSQATIDLFDLGKQLPSFKAVDGKAPYASSLPPCIVIGAKDDFIVDNEGLEETAAYFNCGAPVIVDSPHDVMLGAKWKNGADALEHWISGLKL
jgi:pimeloyl-ACP methyl ester carboxylesterase